VERKANGRRAYALEVWAESRERIADELRDRADCLARLGFTNEAARDRYVSLRLWAQAGKDRAEAANLWRWSNLESYASPEAIAELVGCEHIETGSRSKELVGFIRARYRCRLAQVLDAPTLNTAV
jgi:hypothetical protein